MDFLSTLLVLTLASTAVVAYDPGVLQDICVAVDDTKEAVLVNGKFCKDPNLTTADDFYFTGFREPGNTSNGVGSITTFAYVDEFPGINTLGVSMTRIDYAPFGVNPPHFHPRGSEMMVVIEGRLLVGFVTSNELQHRLFTKVLNPGDMFIFPVGLVHFMLNTRNTSAVTFSGLGGQNPGVVTVARTVFGAHPSIPVNVLTKAFQLNETVVENLLSYFS